MIAKLVLLLWPVVMIGFYRHYSLPVALVASLMGAYLLLPQGGLIDLPMLPALGRSNISILAALILTAVALRSQTLPAPAPRGWLPRDPVAIFCLLLLLVGAFLTARTNGDTLVYGTRVIPGLKIYDAFSIIMNTFLFLLALFLGRRVLSSPEGMKTLLIGFAIAALCYTPLVLYEVRMSPQLHTKIYGFFQHSFAQHMRGSGYRPVVFLDHGLSLSLFLSTAVLSTVALMRFAAEGQRLKWAVAGIYLMGVLVLSKSLGPLLILFVLFPFAAFYGPRAQLLVATCVAVMVLTYPVLRSAHIVPLNQVVSFAESIDEQRAASFITRLENEEALLEKAQERPLYGWGSWGRNRIFDDKGRNLSITDGAWILTLGNGGWARYIGFYGLLCWPIIGLFLARRDKIDPVSAMLALLLCGKLVDLIPNSGMPHVYWLIAGALLGRLEVTRGQQEDAPAPVRRDDRPGYSRGDQPAAAARTEDAQYSRRFAGKKARPRAPEKAAPGTAYKRPAPGAGYRR